MYEPYIKGQVFVGMPFRPEMQSTYATIVDECKKLNLSTKRVDELHCARAIIDDIKELIEESEFILIDLTDEELTTKAGELVRKANANVYYELGYTDGVGNEHNDVLLIAKTGSKILFDVSHRRVNFYDSEDSLRTIIFNGFEELKAKSKKQKRNKK